jgi:MFS family permease
MVSVMNLTGYVVVEHHHHAQDDVFPIIGAHTFGMFALVLFVGPMIDQIGRGRSLWIGLVLMGASCIGLAWFESVLGTGLLLFGLGLGWSVSFVAATAQLADRAAPAERGKLLGFNDQLSALLGAAFALLGGFALDTLGVAALAIGATVAVLLPVATLLRRRTGVRRFSAAT